MRGIQIVNVLPSGAAAESDDIVKDLESWFEDHQQMCRLISVASSTDACEVASNLDRLKASVDSGHRLFSMLKSSYSRGSTPQPQIHRASCSIPLSGMNRFDENRNHSSASASTNSASTNVRPVSTPSVTFGVAQSVVSVQQAEQPRFQPSRTYLKKSGT